MNFRFFRKRLHLPNIRYFVGFSCRASLFLQITRLCDVSQFLPLRLPAEDDVTRRLSPTFLFPCFLHLEEYLLVHPGFLLPASRRFPPPRPPAGDDAARRLSPRPPPEFRPPSSLPQAAATNVSGSADSVGFSGGISRVQRTPDGISSPSSIIASPMHPCRRNPPPNQYGSVSVMRKSVPAGASQSPRTASVGTYCTSHAPARHPSAAHSARIGFRDAIPVSAVPGVKPHSAAHTPNSIPPASVPA